MKPGWSRVALRRNVKKEILRGFSPSSLLKWEPGAALLLKNLMGTKMERERESRKDSLCSCQGEEF